MQFTLVSAPGLLLVPLVWSLHYKTCLSLHHPPKIQSDASNNMNLCHGVSTVLISLRIKAVLWWVTWGHAEELPLVYTQRSTVYWAYLQYILVGTDGHTWHSWQLLTKVHSEHCSSLKEVAPRAHLHLIPHQDVWVKPGTVKHFPFLTEEEFSTSFICVNESRTDN